MPRITALQPMLNLEAADEIPIVDVSEATTKKVTFGMLMPTGSVTDFAGAAAPAGWLLCYGQTLNATTNPEYAALYAVIGTTFGGTGITSFNVPDLRGRVTAGADAMGGTAANRLGTAGLGAAAVRGATGGAETHTLTVAQMPAHTHTWTRRPQWYSGEGGTGGNIYSQNTSTNIGRVGGSDLNNEGGGGAHNNVQPTFVLNKIIKY